MEIYCPEYYNDFACLAGKCPDSCCKEWSVDVDKASAAFYRNLSGSLGDRLRQVLQDTDDGTVMTIENSRCPMWREDGLCRIQAELGHDALCKVCRDFPRLRHDYGNFAELGLELSCPEAARLILSDKDSAWIATAPQAESSQEYDADIMRILLNSRKAFLDFLDSTTLPVPKILAILLLYSYDVQEELDGGNLAALEPERYLAEISRFSCAGDVQALLDFFLGLEILTPAWKKRLEMQPTLPVWDIRHKALLRYFMCRYWLQAVSDYDVVCRGKFAVIACLLIACLGGNLPETAQLFSKEIENDPDNVEAILDGTYTSPALTDLYLLGILKD